MTIGFKLRVFHIVDSLNRLENLLGISLFNLEKANLCLL